MQDKTNELYRVAAALGAELSVADVTIHAYDPSGSGAFEKMLQECKDLLPSEAHEVINVVEASRLGDIPRAALSQIALRTVRNPTVWLHYALMNTYARLQENGAEGARGACMLHALLFLDAGAPNKGAEQYTRRILANLALPFSPVDAVRHAMTARVSSFDANVQRFLPPMDDAPASPTVLEIAHHLGLPPPETLAEPIAISAADSVRSIRFLGPEERNFLVDPEYPRHYIFNPSKLQNAPAIDVFTLEDAIISVDVTYPGASEFYVFDKLGQCIREFSFGESPFIEESVTEIEGDIAILDDQFPEFNVCHLFYDKITRIKIYQDTIGFPDFYLLFNKSDYYISIFNIIGIGSQRLFIPKATRYSIRASSIHLSSNITTAFSHPAHFGSDWAAGFLSEKLRSKKRAKRKLFISREDAASRRILNWSDIEPIIGNYGFEVVVLSSMTLDEQVSIFNEAAVVVGVHGAGLANIVFCPESIDVVEILPPMCATPAYWIAAQALNHRYHAVMAIDPDYGVPDHSQWQHNAKFIGRDVIIPVDHFSNVLSRIEHS